MRWASMLAALSLALPALAQQGSGRPGRLMIGAVLLVVIAALAAATIAGRSRRGTRPRPGRLPGDLRFERPGCVVYVPLTTALLASVALTLLLGGAGWLVRALTAAFGWVGSLPGDLRFETGGAAVFLPIASALVLSVAATLLVNLVLWLLGRRRSMRQRPNGEERDEQGRRGGP